MILRNKICLFAIITTLLSFAFIFRHLAVAKLSPIIRVDKGIRPPPLVPDPHNVGNDTVADVPVGAGKTGHTHYDEKGKPREWTLEEWLTESKLAREEAESNWNTKPLEELCARTEWRDDLVFECLSEPDNSRQNILTCIRYALDAGASIYIPFFDRFADPLTNKHPLTSFSYPALLFRQRIYATIADPTLSSVCPELKLYPVNDKAEDHIIGPTVIAPRLHPDDLPHYGPVTSVRNYVHQLANKNQGIRTMIPFGPVGRYYPVCSNGADFVDGFGQLLMLGDPQHHVLADEILYSLHSEYGVPLTPGGGIPESSDKKNGFLGIKFELSSGRTANPSVDLGLTTRSLPFYEAQRNFFIKRMRSSRHRSHGLKVVYISAPKPIFDRFREDVEDVFGHGIMKFVRQEESGNDDGLGEVVRGIIDHLVLLRSQYFLGIADGDMSWQTALQRRKNSKGGSCGYRKPWIPTVWGSAMWDERNDLMGDRHYDEEWKMWP